MEFPLMNKLRKRLHREVALIQDELVEIVYTVCPDAVLHGGTAIWRCYAGRRFSEDLDFYFPVGDSFEQDLRKELKSRSLNLLKFKRTENTIFSKISSENVEVRLEVDLRKPKNFVVESFERVNGTKMDIFTLSIEDLILEKITAYKSRKLIRDFYDIYFLSEKLQDKKKVKESLKELIANPPEPADEKNLKTVVFFGAVPSFNQMLEKMRRVI